MTPATLAADVAVLIDRELRTLRREIEAYPDERDVPDFSKRPPWFVATYSEPYHSGLTFEHLRRRAYVDDARAAYDTIRIINDAIPHHQDKWNQGGHSD